MDNYDLKIEEIVDKTICYKAEKKHKDGTIYYSYNAQVAADLFEPFSHSFRQLAEASATYGFVLSKKIEELSQNDEVVNMSANHICDETLAHLLIWFYWAKKLGFGIAYRACIDIDLNIDENRFPIKQFIGIVGHFRKRSVY